MAVLLKPREPSAHWYSRDGAPAHRIPKKDGVGDRPTNISDARRLGLLPSVTTVLSILSKPQLEKWKMRQVALATLRVQPKSAEEPPEYYAERVIDEAFQQVEDAADLGTRIHAALEHGLAGEHYPEEMEVYVEPVFRWKAEKRIEFTARELVVVNAGAGFAGKCDVFCTFGKQGKGILDFKTKKTEPGKSPEAYPEFGMQLAAYAATHYGVDALPEVRAANIVISTTEPGRMEIVKHENLPELYACFLNACEVWRFLKGYDPRQWEGVADVC